MGNDLGVITFAGYMISSASQETTHAISLAQKIAEDSAVRERARENMQGRTLITHT
eukprot:CAMPEP_0206503690 /NCGR_PEP_ID=MMETSP0324_2-20121206/54920_1 /ASSEMBLY_ACC=CAM_ASM_000836 /TAXON_ID=2866 /ORGANISM="Crypthecodinium cohnii, Strain Seligo" /LENGTH=55 /DNA_ID=CAMNT_0053992477 /DNA_START=96 /DNA_END=259 /DNA_ORIENTATION=+